MIPRLLNRLTPFLLLPLAAPLFASGCLEEGPEGDPSRLYIVPSFNFTTAGDWILTLTGTLPDGRVARIRKRTNVVGALPGPPGGHSE